MEKILFNKALIANLKAIKVLKTMVQEMLRKELDIHRITRIISLSYKAGISLNSFPVDRIRQFLDDSRYSDGGWVAVYDTIWNLYFYKIIGDNTNYEKGLKFLNQNRGPNGLWGRYNRDRNRIPISALVFWLFPEIISTNDVKKMEDLWKKEFASLTYKAAYTLLAFKSVNYISPIIKDTIKWLCSQQREDGSFAPWKEHPVESNILWISLSLISLLTWKHLLSDLSIPRKALEWILSTQLPQGIWRYHEIEEGASWALLAISIAMKEL